MITRRNLLLGLGVGFPLLFSGCGEAISSPVETVTDLAALATDASTRNLPIMLFVTAPHCRYCHQLERDVIVPMTKNPRYAPLVLLRRLDLGTGQVIDFNGQTQDPVRLASRYKAQLTPTILFLSPSGEILADKIQGVVQDIDQYGGMIDQRINQALSRLGNTARIVHG